MWVASLFLLAGAAATAQNQNPTDSPGQGQTQGQSQTQDQNKAGQPANSSNSSGSSSAQQGKGQKGAAEDNAFPIEQSRAAAKSGSQDAAPQQPGNQSSGSSTAKQNQQSPAKDNPFPEDQSAAAAKSNGGQGQSAAPGGSQSSSSSSGGYSSSDENLPAPELGDGSLKESNKKMDSYTRDQTEDGRVKDDLNVADFYMKNGNYRGAFSRYEDALQYDPQNDTALFGRAFAMCKQNMTNDAMAQFKTYTKTNPQGKYALKAEKLLAHPNKCKHNF
ncbi:MAG TPA: tetratricopeptide repeat protein [Acidobacteriaceae bacterium]|nr:tetratricopeptide repeat protein [Acidobacteriaceae bacterium]